MDNDGLTDEQRKATEACFNLPVDASGYVLGFLAVEVPEAFLRAVEATRYVWDRSE